MSDDELISRTNLKKEKIRLLDPASKDGYLGAYLVFTTLGFLVLYLYRRRIQKINDRINYQLDAMM